ncbi:hypothetical protein K488DRAFT_9522, partial [Vararia minispora EC-137]
RKKRNISELFMHLVDRDAWAEYYEIIKEPRSLSEVSQKLSNSEYNTVLQAWQDLSLVFLNAKHFNEAGSQIYKDADVLQDKLTKAWAARPVLSVRCILTPVQVRTDARCAVSPQPQPQAGPSTATSPTQAVPATPAHAAAAPSTSAFQPQTQAAQVGITSPPRLPSPDMDIDVGGTPEPEGGMDETARDEEGEAIIQQLERGLPRWQGLGEEGWILEGPPERWLELVQTIKGHKDAVGNRLATALESVPETVDIPYLSFSHPLSLKLIEGRARSKSFESNNMFDHEMMRLFEKCRRWHDPGGDAYGSVLLLQRLYQALTGPNPPSGPPYVSTTNFASLRAGPASRADTTVTSFRVSAKDRTFVEEVYYKGWSFRQADWVHVANPDDPSRPIMGQVFKCWLSDEAHVKGQPGITVCWYYRPEQTVHPAHRQFWENEVFKTSHFADHPLEDVIEKVAVQFTARHIRGRPRPPYWYLGWPIYVCDSRYNDRERVFVKIKNWNSCVPEEVRKSTEFMPIYPFERMVYPRRFDSPFLHGKTRGPGGIGEPVDRADGEKTEGGGTGRKRSKKPGAPSDITGPTKGLYVGVPGASGAASASASASAARTASAPQQQQQQQGYAEAIEDRTVITAAGGYAALGSNAAMEKLPPATVKHFDRSPETNQVLWFAAPPVDVARPRPPQYSLKYLHWLATKKRKAEPQDGEGDGMDVDGEAKRRRAVPQTATERVGPLLADI